MLFRSPQAEAPEVVATPVAIEDVVAPSQVAPSATSEEEAAPLPETSASVVTDAPSAESLVEAATVAPVEAVASSVGSAASEASESAREPRTVRLQHWPSPEDLEVPETPVWRRPWLIAVVVAVLFGVGWWLGHQIGRAHV